MLLCDEPTGALDVRTGIVVLEALERANRELGTLTVIITHNVVMAEMADRVIRFMDGRVLSEAPQRDACGAGVAALVARRKDEPPATKPPRNLRPQTPKQAIFPVNARLDIP